MRRRALLAAALAALAAAGVARAAPVQPNDPTWPSQRALRQLGLPQLWERTTGDPKVVIAVVDTGVTPIPDLSGTLAPGVDFVDGDDDPQDLNSHGTRVASVIAARGNDGAGIVGHCWRCRILPVRVSANGTASAPAVAAGIVWAVNNGARIVNVSLGHAGQDAAEAAAVQYALDRGAIVVAAAGNTGADTPQYPAAYPGVLSVGGTDDADRLYFWSSRGAWVQLAAPGCHIVADARWAPGELCGTSFTPAAVAGVLGLIWSLAPALSREQVLAAILGTARRVAGVAHGRIDPVAAFRRLGLLEVPAPPPATAPRAPAAGRFVRQTLLETGTFKGGFRRTFTVGAGRLELQLLTPHAAACTLTLAAADELIVAWPAVRNLLGLSVPVTAGRYTAVVRCRGDRTRQYSLGVIAMFPRLP